MQNKKLMDTGALYVLIAFISVSYKLTNLTGENEAGKLTGLGCELLFNVTHLSHHSGLLFVKISESIFLPKEI